ncbi:hypothetical protein ABND82_18860, partial [Paenibacillus larvae]
RAMNMAPFIFWNLAFYTIIRTQLRMTKYILRKTKCLSKKYIKIEVKTVLKKFNIRYNGMAKKKIKTKVAICFSIDNVSSDKMSKIENVKKEVDINNNRKVIPISNFTDLFLRKYPLGKKTKFIFIFLLSIRG